MPYHKPVTTGCLVENVRNGLDRSFFPKYRFPVTRGVLLRIGRIASVVFLVRGMSPGPTFVSAPARTGLSSNVPERFSMRSLVSNLKRGRGAT
jgi:hypothetical protein